MKKILKMIVRIIKTLAKIFAGILLVAVAAVAVMSISPIYRFAQPEPFSGDKIYNPYADFDSTIGWKRANMHTHTKVDKGINECPYYPDVVFDDYMGYGYDILGFSNHQALTPHPVDSSLYIGLYEHGYNLFKFHLNPYGVKRVRKFDHLLPIFRSQKQFMIDLLAEDGDMVQFNHPDRTGSIDRKTMESLSGYRLIEGEASFSEKYNDRESALKHWDEALSAGRYSHNIINDDNHNSKNPWKTARRCSWINTPTPYYEDVKAALLKGNFYSSRVPNYGKGDLEAKRYANHHLPTITGIGMAGDTIFMTLSAPAAKIIAISQNGVIVDSTLTACSFRYVMRENDPYIRLTAFYDDGLTIYSNAFARYSEGDSPYRDFPHPVRIGATIFFNLALLLIFGLTVFGFVCLFRRKRK